MFKSYFVAGILKKFLRCPRYPDFRFTDGGHVLCLVNLDKCRYVDKLSDIGEMVGCKTFDIIGFTENEVKAIHSAMVGYLVSKNAYSFFGVLTDKNLKNKLNREYDLLINYFCDLDTYLLLTGVLVNAGLRVGFSSVDERYNDLVINTDMDRPKVFAEEMMKYIKPKNI